MTDIEKIKAWIRERIDHIVVVEANPETLEFKSQVFIQDINKDKVYVFEIKQLT